VNGPGEPAGPDEPGDAEPGTGAAEIVEELMAGFRRTPRGVSARFTSAQAGIVRSLVGQVADLVGGAGAASAPQSPPTRPSPAGPGQTRRSERAMSREEALFAEDLDSIMDSGGPTGTPEDPVLARLFPDAYGDDPEAAGDFRRYTEQGLRDGKVAAARTVLATLPDEGGRIRLSAGDAEAWLRALNDVRLALGVLLEIKEDYERELADETPADPRSAYLQVYDWLTFLQETLVRSLR
jgi:Domain of unknown function (DUF2017)